MSSFLARCSFSEDLVISFKESDWQYRSNYLSGSEMYVVYNNAIIDCQTIGVHDFGR